MNESKIEIFCDFETSGTNHLEDQPLTFSAKAFKDGKKIDEINTNCRMDRSRLPSPIALAVNQILTNNLIEAQSLRDMMFEINQLYEKHKPAKIFAHNAPFDFRFCHSGHFQTLTTDDWYQWKTGGNMLIDTLELIRAIYSFKRDFRTLQIPKTQNNLPQFGLEALSKANGLSYQSHEAEGDVKSLRDLFSLMKNEAPEIVSRAFCSAEKKEAERITKYSMFFCTTTGAGRTLKARPLVPLAKNIIGNSIICADISAVNYHELISLSAHEIYHQCKNHKISNCIHIIPLNKAKVLLTPEYYEYCTAFSQRELFDRTKKIRKSKHIQERVQEAWRHIESDFETDDKSLSSSIYRDGWCTHSEQEFIDVFNKTEWTERWQLTESNSLLEPDNRIIRLAKKVIFEQDQYLVPEQLREHICKKLNRKLFHLDLNNDVAWMNMPKVISEIEKLNSDPSKRSRVIELERYYKKIQLDMFQNSQPRKKLGMR